MTRWQRPTPAPLERRRAALDRLRRVDPRTAAMRILIASAVVLLTQLGWQWRSATAQLSEGQTLVVMERSVLRGQPVTEADIRRRRWPIGLMPAGALTELPADAVADVDLVAGEVLVADRLFPSPNGLQPGERLVTIPQPLAGSPASVGTSVELFGLLPIAEGVTTPAIRLAVGTVVLTNDAAISIAVDAVAVPTIIEHLTLGSVQVVITP